MASAAESVLYPALRMFGKTTSRLATPSSDQGAVVPVGGVVPLHPASSSVGPEHVPELELSSSVEASDDELGLLESLELLDPPESPPEPPPESPPPELLEPPLA